MNVETLSTETVESGRCANRQNLFDTLFAYVDIQIFREVGWRGDHI